MANGGYAPPIRDRSLTAERTDQGKDFGGSGPIYSIGDGIVRQVSRSSGWPGGGWVSITLTDGPRKGWTFYVSEYVIPNVHQGQHVNANTVIAHQYSGIEMGWVSSPHRGNPNAMNALSSQVGDNAIQRGISKSDPGAAPSAEGRDFATFLQSLEAGGGGTSGPAGPTAAAPTTGQPQLTPQQKSEISARQASAAAPGDVGAGDIYEPDSSVNDVPQLWAQIAGQDNIAAETAQVAAQYLQDQQNPLQVQNMPVPIPATQGMP